MEDPFILEVPYYGTVHAFDAQLYLLGYTHRFVVSVPPVDLWFERDESGDYRALLPPDTPEKEAAKLDPLLLEAIARQIESILA